MKNIFIILLFLSIVCNSTHCLADEDIPFVIDIPTMSSARFENDFKRILFYIKKTFPKNKNGFSLFARIDTLSYERKSLLLTAFSHLIPDNVNNDIVFTYKVTVKSSQDFSDKKNGTLIANFYYLSSDRERFYNVEVVKK